MILPETVDTVLVPVDGSEYSRRGVIAGSAIADRVGADLEVLSTVAKDDEVPERDAEVRELLEKWLGPAGRRVERTIAVDLDPAGEIHETLRRIGRAVACMATHGRGRSAALIGSVATELIVRCHDAAVLAGPVVEEPPPAPGIVACVDDDDAARAVVEAAIAWWRLLGDPVTVVSVVEPAPPPLRGTPPDREVEAFLERLVEPYVETLPITWKVVPDPISPAGGVVTYLDEHPSFLVVVGSHARTGIARIVFGSTAASIVRQSEIPVFVVPIAGSDR